MGLGAGLLLVIDSIGFLEDIWWLICLLACWSNDVLVSLHDCNGKEPYPYADRSQVLASSSLEVMVVV